MIVLSPLLVAAAVTLTVQQPSSAQETVTEPATGVVFPVRLRPTGDAEYVLTGTGVRTKTVAKVKVYAFGLYVDQAAAATTLAQWAGRQERELQEDAAFYGALLKDNFTKTLRLVMTRDVDGTKMSEAFNEALTPRIDLATRFGMVGGKAALATFRGYFNVPTMTTGSELIFTWAPGGTLRTIIQGKPQDDIASLALCWALFDAYLGQEPISSNGKKTVIARFPQLLQPAQH